MMTICLVFYGTTAIAVARECATSIAPMSPRRTLFCLLAGLIWPFEFVAALVIKVIRT
jgi:hypothetical protein